MADEKKLKVLLTDDDSFLLDIYSLKFRDSGHTVEIALGGEQAIKVLKDGFKADIVVVDLVMPELDGLELIEKIKKDKLADGAVLIVLSNQSSSEQMAEAKELGANGFIVKASATPSEVLAQVLAIYNKNKK